MSKRTKPAAQKATRSRGRGATRSPRLTWAGVIVALGIAAAALTWTLLPHGPRPVSLNHTNSSTGPQPAAINSHNADVPTNAALPSYQVAQAVMVTVELDFGGKPPSIKEAL